MNVEEAFLEYQRSVNADDAQVKEARRRRDLFKTAFNAEPDVAEVIASGSLARGTQKAPIRDVDAIIIFKDDSHSGWGDPGDSAAEALSYVGSRVNTLLGANNGEKAKEVRLAKPRNHAVKCFLDDPGAFTVDAMPAFRRDGMLLVPEKRSWRWVPTDPEYLIGLTKKAHSEWNSFAPLVRVLKVWKTRLPANLEVKSLYLEVLALECLPREGGACPGARRVLHRRRVLCPHPGRRGPSEGLWSHPA